MAKPRTTKTSDGAERASAVSASEEKPKEVDLTAESNVDQHKAPPLAHENDLAAHENNLATHIEITARRPRRRAGMSFGPAPVTVHLGDLTDEQLEAINADPMLKVTTAKPEAD